jgi:threonylcarbamoyladenosine tRNA methylthiotransferase MtaB
MNTEPSVAFHTLGCKLNFSETSAIARQLSESGYRKVDFSECADVYVINTCSVTENADRECRKIVRDALAISPNAVIAVIGCYAQLKPQEIATIEGVDLVLGASEKFKLATYLSDLKKREHAHVHACEIEEANFFVDAWSFGDRARAFLKVQDGCDYTCSFCTIPLARGSSRSDTIDHVLQNARQIADLGVKEIVLTGVNLGDFGKGHKGGKQHEETFYELVQALDTVAGIERFRISSIEPNLLRNEIIAFVAQSKRFVPHFHIPLQSGSDKILKLMRRRYMRQLYVDRVATIRRLIPDCCIGVDVITGFPGETEQDFLDTYTFLNELDISYLHVFTYSERDNTDAIALPDNVPIHERRKRTKMLRSLSVKKSRQFYSHYEGHLREVLFENENHNGWITGYTDNYIKVRVPFDQSLMNTIRTVTLQSISDDGIMLGKENTPVLIAAQ